MTLLEKTFNILKQDDKDTDYHFVKPIRPEEGHPFTFNQFNIPQVRSVKCTKEKLSKVLAFIQMKHQVRFSDGYTVMKISTTNKKLLSMCGTQASVSNFISYMIQIGLLAEYDETYQFNAYYDKDNKCKSYIYSYDTEQIIKQYCKDNNINIYRINNNTNNTTIVKKFKEDVKSFEKSGVRFSSKLNLMKPDNFSTTDFEEYLTMCLYENYPQLEYYQKLADFINEKYYSDDINRQIQFRPNFTWKKGNKIVKKIGIRATNSLVSSKKEREEGDDGNILYRDDVLKQYNLSYEFDVKSSVPRVTYLINNGVWLNNNIDLYRRMYRSFVKKCPSERMDWNEKTRHIFKTFHMRGYFDTYTELSAHIKFAISKKIEYKKEDWSDLDYVMQYYKQAIQDTVGELKYDSEIFFHESCIYLDVLNALLSNGYDVLQIYDGFYTDKPVESIEDIIKYTSETYYNNNINTNKYTNDTKDNDNDNDNVDTDNNNKDINKYRNNDIYTTIVKKFNEDGFNVCCRNRNVTFDGYDYMKQLVDSALQLE